MTRVAAATGGGASSARARRLSAAAGVFVRLRVEVDLAFFAVIAIPCRSRWAEMSAASKNNLNLK
jgi:hypothetical protein